MNGGWDLNRKNGRILWERLVGSKNNGRIEMRSARQSGVIASH
jgi:hypothetical protein